MKTIGLIGGMSWHSTVQYYRVLNESMSAALGGLHSAKVILHSVDFADVEPLQRAGDWDAAARLLVPAARSLQASGADFLVLCTNTLHMVAADIEHAVSIPLLHIADAAGRALVAAGHRRVGLLGTRYTMELPFLKDHLRERYGLQVLVPDPAERAAIHRIIYEELCLGRLLPRSQAQCRQVIESLKAAGAEVVVLGCTEISLLLKDEVLQDEEAPLPVFDTTLIHARSAVARALE